MCILFVLNALSVCCFSQQSPSFDEMLKRLGITNLPKAREDELRKKYADPAIDAIDLVRELSALNGPKLELADLDRERKALIGGCQLILGHLGYGVRFTEAMDEQMRDGIKRFQRVADLKATGSLNLEVVNLLGEISNAYDAPRVQLPSKSFYWSTEQGYVGASGTFKMLNGKSSTPLQTSEVACDRQENTCRVMTILFRRSATEIAPDIIHDEFKVAEWGQAEILTAPMETRLGCVRYVLRINKAQQSVTQIRSTVSTVGLCADTDKQEYFFQLEDGPKISTEYSEGLDGRWKRYLYKHEAKTPSTRDVK